MRMFRYKKKNGETGIGVRWKGRYGWVWYIQPRGDKMVQNADDFNQEDVTEWYDLDGPAGVTITNVAELPEIRKLH